MTPIKIDIVKNPEKAPSMGAKFGQDVEPTGTYVTKSSRIPNGWVGGTAILQNPLFVNVNQDNLIQYKRDLAQQYKAKGNALTKKLMSNGHDALITKYSDGSFGEIVLFPNANFILDKKGITESIMNNQYKYFLQQVKTNENAHLVESIESGFKAIFEGWCDVRPDPSERSISTVDRFNRNAAVRQAQIGCNVLSNLVSFRDHIAKPNWQEDDEPWLDNYSSSEFADDMKLRDLQQQLKRESPIGDVGMPKGGF